MTDNTLSASLDALVAQVTTWLKPTVEADCRHQEAAKLRIFLRNLEEARDQARLQEEGMAAELVLAQSLEDLAESFAGFPDPAIMTRATIANYVAALTELSAYAWALEMYVRRHAGVIADTDLETLALARSLILGGVQRADRLGQGQPSGGDAA